MKKVALYILIGASLVGCGSDDSRPGVMPGLPPGGTVQPSPPQDQGDSNPNEPPTDSNEPPANPNDTPNELLSGVYKGKTGAGEILEGLIDDNKRLWFIYSNSNRVLGFTNSNNKIKASNGEFSAKGKDYSYPYRNTFDVTIEGDYKTSKVIQGNMFELPSNPVAYSVTYDEYLSAKKQSLDMIKNKTFFGDSYITGDSEVGDTTINVSTDGDFTGNGEGCSMTGKFTVSESQRYFVSTVTFGKVNCFAPGETHTGVALLDTDNELVFLGTHEGKGSFFSGAAIRE